jgi:hypothetical protein
VRGRRFLYLDFISIVEMRDNSDRLNTVVQMKGLMFIHVLISPSSNHQDQLSNALQPPNQILL